MERTYCLIFTGVKPNIIKFDISVNGSLNNYISNMITLYGNITSCACVFHCSCFYHFRLFSLFWNYFYDFKQRVCSTRINIPHLEWKQRIAIQQIFPYYSLWYQMIYVFCDNKSPQVYWKSHVWLHYSFEVYLLRLVGKLSCVSKDHANEILQCIEKGLICLCSRLYYPVSFSQSFCNSISVDGNCLRIQ